MSESLPLREHYLALIDEIIETTLKGKISSVEPVYELLLKGITSRTGEVFELVLSDRLNIIQSQIHPKTDELNMQYNSVIVTIATVNFDNIVGFYTQLLEQKPQKLIPHIYAEFQLAGLKLGIFQPKSADKSEFVTNSRSPLSLCLEVNNLEAAISHLKSLGYPPPAKVSTASHGQEIYAYDPDGNRLILHQSLK